MLRQPIQSQINKSQQGIALIEVTLVLPFLLLLLALIVDFGRVFYEVSLLQGRVFAAARYIAIHVPITEEKDCNDPTNHHYEVAEYLALNASGHGSDLNGRFNSFQCQKYSEQDHWEVSAKYDANFILKDLLPDSLGKLTVNVFAIHRATL